MSFLTRTALLFSISACVGPHTGEPLGSSHRSSASQPTALDGSFLFPPFPSSRDAGDAESPLPERDGGIPRDLKTSFHQLNRQRFLSKGHAAGKYMVDIWANDAGRDAYLQPFAEMPVGAIFVKEHFDLDAGTTGVGLRMMMEKRPPGYDPNHSDWRYVVENVRYQVLEDGQLETCLGCHSDAPSDHVFRVRDDR